MNKNSNLNHLIEVLNSIDRSLDLLIEQVQGVSFLNGYRPQPLPVRTKRPGIPFKM